MSDHETNVVTTVVGEGGADESKDSKVEETTAPTPTLAPEDPRLDEIVTVKCSNGSVDFTRREVSIYDGITGVLTGLEDSDDEGVAGTEDTTGPTEVTVVDTEKIVVTVALLEKLREFSRLWAEHGDFTIPKPLNNNKDTDRTMCDHVPEPYGKFADEIANGDAKRLHSLQRPLPRRQIKAAKEKAAQGENVSP